MGTDRTILIFLRFVTSVDILFGMRHTPLLTSNRTQGHSNRMTAAQSRTYTRVHFQDFVVLSNCPVGWIDGPSNQQCYKLQSDVTNWYDARQMCKAKGGDLATIHDQATKLFIIDLIEKAHNESFPSWKGIEPKRYWVGLWDRHSDGRFEWIDGRKLNSTEPVVFTGKGEDCGTIHLYKNEPKCISKYCYTDKHCAGSKGYIFPSVCSRGHVTTSNKTPSSTTTPRPVTTTSPRLTTTPRPVTITSPSSTTTSRQMAMSSPSLTTTPRQMAIISPSLTTTSRQMAIKSPSSTFTPRQMAISSPSSTTTPRQVAIPSPSSTTTSRPMTTTSPSSTITPRQMAITSSSSTTTPRPVTTTSSSSTTTPRPVAITSPSPTTTSRPVTITSPSSTTTPRLVAITSPSSTTTSRPVAITTPYLTSPTTTHQPMTADSREPVRQQTMNLLRNLTSPQTGTAPTSLCPCRCPVKGFNPNPSPQELVVIFLKIQKELKVDKNHLSSSRNKKISALDNRKGSHAIGFLSLALCLVPFGVVVASDVIRIFK